MVPTAEMYDTFKRRVVVALDVDTLDQAIELSTRLRGRAEKFKIGSRLFTKYGPEILDRLGDVGAQVFLDLKFHDIPSVVGAACKNAADHPAVFLMTVHAAGGRAMLEAAVAGVQSSGRGLGGDLGQNSADSVKIVAVTALTSLSAADLPEIGVDCSIEAWIHRLAGTALAAGLDGLVCSSHEVEVLRRDFGPEALLVTPGIRLPEFGVLGSGALGSGALGSGKAIGQKEAADDQARVVTPAQALQAGSDLLVIGRPIYQAADPVAVVDRIARSLS